MLSVWRLVTARFAKSAFSGDGARLYGGRWNRKGVPLVYTAATQSLAMLEMLVQDEPLRARYVMIEVRIPKGVQIDRVKVEDLPVDWRSIAAREKLQAIGTEWARKRSAAVLAVPSAVIPAEINYLLNALHPDFRRIKVGKPQRFETDFCLELCRAARMFDYALREFDIKPYVTEFQLWFWFSRSSPVDWKGSTAVPPRSR